MKAKEIVSKYGFNKDSFERFIEGSGIKHKKGLGGISIDDALDVKEIVEKYYQYNNELRAAKELREKDAANKAHEKQARLEKIAADKAGIEFSLMEFAETRQKNIKQFGSWVDDTLISGLARHCHGILSNLDSENARVEMCLGMCDDELILYENRLFSKPDIVYSFKISDIIWEDSTLSEELGIVTLKYLNNNNGNVESFMLRRQSTGSWSVNQFINKVNELSPDTIKNKPNGENVRYITFERAYTTVKFDHANEMFELYQTEASILQGYDRAYDFIVSAKYSDIINCELTENNISVIKGGLAAAAVGGALFGGVGAIVGSNVGSKTSQEVMGQVDIIVTVNNINNPVINIPLFPHSVIKVPKTGAGYEQWQRNVNELLGMFSVVLNNNSKNNDTSQLPQINTGADDLRKYKELLDDGIITKEEFEEVKKRILAL